MTLVAPVVLAIVLLVIQVSLVFHARQVADAAAGDGLRAAQANGATLDDGRAAAQQFAAADETLNVQRVEVSPNGRRVRVVVVGTAPSVFPGLSTRTVSGVAEGPTEVFLRPGQR